MTVHFLKYTRGYVNFCDVFIEVSVIEFFMPFARALCFVSLLKRVSSSGSGEMCFLRHSSVIEGYFRISFFDVKTLSLFLLHVVV
jgi:hypothetical protein